MIKVLKDESFNEEIKEGKVLVDFYADWCGPCRNLAPVLEEVQDKIKIVKVNVDNFPDIAREYKVMSIPLLILFEDGKEIKTNLGFLTKNELENFIK